MGRNTFLPALGAGQWPWPGLQVYVLTTRPLPDRHPADVIAAPDPAALPLRLLRADRIFPDGSAELSIRQAVELPRVFS